MGTNGRAGSEQGFVAALDAAQEYMALQAALAEALRSGFLSLAQARYSMGADRVSSLQFPSHMRATARLHAAEDGDLELAIVDPARPGDKGGGESTSPASSPASTDSSSRGWAKADGSVAAGAAAARALAGGKGGSGSGGSKGPTATRAAADAGEEGLEGELQRLRLAADQSSGILQQLAAKYACAPGEGDGGGSGGPRAATAGSSSAGGGEDDEYAEVVPPGRPLAWFGSLVAPSLRQAEAHFSSALALAVQAANAQRRLRSGIDGWRQEAAAAEAEADGGQVAQG